MKTLLFTLSFMISLNLLIAPVLAEVNINLLKQKYSKCEDISYRHDCFHDSKFSLTRVVGYFKNNDLWEGLVYKNDILIWEYINGKRISKSYCQDSNDGWTICPSGTRYKELRTGYTDKRGMQGKFRVEHIGGDIYLGQYKDGKMHGKGIHTWKSGSKYDGEWQNDNKHGQGKYTYANGKVKEGIWKNDKFLYSQKKPTPSSSSKIEEYKSFCSEIGLTKGTDKFNECLLVYKNKISPNVNLSINKETKLEKSKIFCKEIGLVNGTDKFNECIAIYSKKIHSNKDVSLISKNDKIVFFGSGTGFAVASNGYLITNYHVISGCNVIKIHKKDKILRASIITSDAGNDIALIKGDFISKAVLPFSSKKTELLQEIYVAGFPFGNKFSTSIKVTKGIISALTGVGNNISNFQIDAAIQPGNSGGPILNKKGNVIGVVVAKLDRRYIEKNFGVVPENTNFGIKINVVKKLLENENMKLTNPNQKDILTSKLSENISNSTYFVSCWKQI